MVSTSKTKTINQDIADKRADSWSASIHRWQSGLLQLDRRNSLLYFNKQNKHSVQIISEPDHIVDLLTRDECGLRFAKPDYSKIPSFQSAAYITGDLQTAGCDCIELQKRLQKLQRKDKEWEEEQGVNVLFLAIGFLNWLDENSTNACAPILLLPCDLNQPELSDHIWLCRELDDIVINATLKHKLALLGITMPPLESESPSEYLSSCESLFQSMGWSVSTDLVLSTFVYSKISMWSDLAVLASSKVRHPLLEMFAGTRPTASTTGDSSLDYELAAGGLDDCIEQELLSIVMESDYSQLLAIDAARQGHHLIIHGPPGTGKSQTISNIIATMLADHKSVLFVSEKTAALDIVKRRLQECDLDAFCLDLHSERGKKDSVYKQLAQSIEEARRVARPRFDYENLKRIKDTLNKDVRSFHGVGSLGLSVYQVFERLATLTDIPKLQLPSSGGHVINQLLEKDLEETLHLARCVAEKSSEFASHFASPWNELRPDPPRFLSVTSFEHKLSKILRSLQTGINIGQIISREIGCGDPRTLHGLKNLTEFFDALLAIPHRHLPLFDKPDLKSLLVVAEDAATAYEQRNRLLSQFRAQPLVRTKVDPEQGEIVRKLRLLPSNGLLNDWTIRNQDWPKCSTMLHRAASGISAFGYAWSEQILVRETKLFADESSVLASFTGRPLGTLPLPNDPGGFINNLELIQKEAGHVNKLWGEFIAVLRTIRLPDQRLRKCQKEISERVADADIAGRLAAEIMQNCQSLADEIVYDHPESFQDIRRLLANATVTQRLYPSSVGRLSLPSCRRTMRLIRLGMRLCAEIKRCEQQLLPDCDLRLCDLLDESIVSRHFRFEHKSVFKGLTKEYKRDDRMISALVKERQEEYKTIATVEKALRLKNLREKWERTSSRLDHLIPDLFCGEQTDWYKIIDLLNERRGLLESNTEDGCENLSDEKMIEIGVKIHKLTRSLWAFHKQIEKVRREPLPLSVHQLGELLSKASWQARLIGTVVDTCQPIPPHVQNLNHLIVHVSEQLDANINLNLLETKIQVGESALGFLAPNFYSPDVISSIKSTIRAQELGLVAGVLGLKNTSTNWQKFRSLCKELRQNLSTVVEQISMLQILFHKPKKWLTLDTAPLDELVAWYQLLVESLPTFWDFLEYREYAKRLNNLASYDLVGALRRCTEEASLVPSILEKQLLTAWLSREIEKDHSLRNFNPVERAVLVNDLKRIDQIELPATNIKRIQFRLYRNFPQAHAWLASGGEFAIVRGELNKKRKRLAIRELLDRAGKLIRVLKPCFMMSPLAVSQYLPALDESGATTFDVLIFDEASQIFPEDAIPSIARCNQIIVVGDSQQLPPTSFFKKSTSDDEQEDEGDTDAFDSSMYTASSILDLMKQFSGRGVIERHLQTHYRSRNDSLINFSNQEFYSGRLCVFPSPLVSTAKTGVLSHYLENGRYDSGKSRTNPVEAEYCVELVFDHLEKYGRSKSLGVIAFSRAQADLILELIIQQRRIDNRFDAFFSESQSEPFFVKNLENVQGDERDHIVLSLCYGPALANGEVYSFFGPLGRSGGHRRLNVAVSRARETLHFVHSLRPAQIRSQQPGPTYLRKFIQYANESNRQVMQASTAIRDKSGIADLITTALANQEIQSVQGYGTETCSFDVAVQSADGDLDFGIQLPTKQFHNSPAASDREWLRDEVLRGLGWNVCRVWPQDFSDSTTMALFDVLRPRIVLETSQTKRREIDFKKLRAPYERLLYGSDRDQEGSLLFPAYCPASLNDLTVYMSGRTYEPYQVAKCLVRIAETEGPVHVDQAVERVRDSLKLQRAGPRLRQVVIDALRSLVRRGDVSANSKSEPEFFWTNDLGGNATPRRPTDGCKARPIEHIAEAELQFGLLTVAESLMSASVQEILQECAKQFGYVRMSKDVSYALEKSLSKLVKEGRLAEANDRIEVVH